MKLTNYGEDDLYKSSDDDLYKEDPDAQSNNDKEFE
jgi:hypothetical protein